MCRLGQFDRFEVVGMIDVDAYRAGGQRLDLLGGELEPEVVHRGGRLVTGELTSVDFLGDRTHPVAAGEDDRE